MNNPNKIVAFLFDTGLLPLMVVMVYAVITIFALNYFFPEHQDLIIIATVIIHGQTLLREFDQVFTSFLMRKRSKEYYEDIPPSFFKDEEE